MFQHVYFCTCRLWNNATAYLSTNLSACQLTCQPVYFYFFYPLFANLSTCLPVYISIFLSVYKFDCLPTCSPVIWVSIFLHAYVIIMIRIISEQKMTIFKFLSWKPKLTHLLLQKCNQFVIPSIHEWSIFCIFQIVPFS